MHEVEVFAGLLAVVVVLALLARPLRVPHAVVLVTGGMVVGALPVAPQVRLDSDLIFLVFLPPILYPSAFSFANEDVRPNVRPIALLALGLVLATMAAVAAAVHVAAGIAWPAAFVLGAVLAPTDPVVATAVIRSAGAPSRLATILEGESLANDGTGLTALRIAIATVGGGFALGSAVGEFVVVAGGGAAVGAALGWATAQLRRRLDDVELEAVIAVLLAYGSFILAERLGVSGILAVVAAGWMMGRRAAVVASPETRLGASSFWSVASFLAESILFLLVGIAFAQTFDDETGRDAWELVGLTVLVCGAAMAVRLAWMFSVPYAAGLFGRRRGGVATLVDPRERAVLAFAGMRGAVSVAAALSIPVQAGGQPFPERATIVAVALASIVVLLVVPALGLPAVLRRAGLSAASAEAERERRARAQLAQAALERAEQLALARQVPEDVMTRVRERHERDLRRYEDHDGARADHERQDDLYRDLRRDVLAAQRRTLDELRERGELSGDALRAIERDLDLQETRLR